MDPAIASGFIWFVAFLFSTTVHEAMHALVAWKGDIYFGLWYTVIVSVMTLVIGTLFLRETKGTDITK